MFSIHLHTDNIDLEDSKKIYFSTLVGIALTAIVKDQLSLNRWTNILLLRETLFVGKSFFKIRSFYIVMLLHKHMTVLTATWDKN